jgi:hypothetical protein
VIWGGRKPMAPNRRRRWTTRTLMSQFICCVPKIQGSIRKMRRLARAARNANVAVYAFSSRAVVVVSTRR